MEFLACILIAVAAGYLIGALASKSWQKPLLLLAIFGPFATYTIWSFASSWAEPAPWQFWVLGLILLGFPMLAGAVATIGGYHLGKAFSASRNDDQKSTLS